MLRRIIAIALAAALGGCALSQSTNQVVLDYNRDFAKSRNEVLLLNVLRAAAREPLQFSTMGTVTGPIGNSAALKIPFTNLIAGGGNQISPELTINDGINPTVNITPLASKEFATGILRPMGTETMQLFLHNGWDAEFLLPLVVGQVICPDGRVLFNSGEYLGPDGRETGLYQAFRTFFRDFAPSFTVGGAVDRTFDLAEKDVLELLKSGPGTNIAVSEVSAAAVGEKRRIKVRDTGQPAVQGDPAAVARLCVEAAEVHEQESLERGTRGLAPLAETKIDPLTADRIAGAWRLGTGPRQPRIVFRSVGSVMQYLGESHRVRYLSGGRIPLTYVNHDGTVQILFKVDWGLDRDAKAVRVRFHDTMFHIPRLTLGRPQGIDRTLKTLSFVDQLIALHTSEASIRGAQPVITVNQ